MSGVTNPQYPITAPFGAAAVSPTDITLPIPGPSQTGVLVGAASFADGFPPATRTDPEYGGVAPYGQDFNGILYMLSQYAMLAQAGQIVPFNAAVATALGGYGVGCVLRSASVSTKFFFNLLDGNTNNPDSVTTGWMVFSPLGSPTLVQSTTLASGTTSDLPLAAGVGFLELNPTAGPADLTGISSANVVEGQILVVSNINGSNLVTMKANDVGSAASARFRLPVDISLPQYSNLTLRHSSTIGLWVPML